MGSVSSMNGRALAIAFVWLGFGCQVPSRALELQPAPPGEDAAEVIRAQAERARTDGRRLLVYVGAKWCEPCSRFHHAAERGELRGRFGELRILEFDFDRDEKRLRAAGYECRLIPLFALPGSD